MPAEKMSVTIGITYVSRLRNYEVRMVTRGTYTFTTLRPIGNSNKGPGTVRRSSIGGDGVGQGGNGLNAVLHNLVERPHNLQGALFKLGLRVSFLPIGRHKVDRHTNDDCGQEESQNDQETKSKDRFGFSLCQLGSSVAAGATGAADRLVGVAFAQFLVVMVTTRVRSHGGHVGEERSFSEEIQRKRKKRKTLVGFMRKVWNPRESSLSSACVIILVVSAQ